ncbi:MAG: Hsp20/alpha crystallin family protein [Flavobacteriaceae bacterium]|nr:Hsp20/alpha crystallin family protein [Flavobacteriaceae bacterium]
MSIVKNTNRFPTFFNHLFDTDVLDVAFKNLDRTNTSIPSVNIKTDDDGFTVEMVAPGFNKADFKIDLKDNKLTISSEKENTKEDNSTYSRREFSYASFSRTFTLPKTADDENIKAKYESGILSVFIPKREEAKPKAPKLIEVA